MTHGLARAGAEVGLEPSTSVETLVVSGRLFVELDDGRRLRGVTDQQVATPQGWVPLNDLRPDDDLHVAGGRTTPGPKSRPKYRHRCRLTGHPFAKARHARMGW